MQSLKINFDDTQELLLLHQEILTATKKVAKSVFCSVVDF